VDELVNIEGRKLMIAKWLLPSITVTAIFLAAEPGAAETGGPQEPLVWNVAHASAPPTVDGQAEALWEQATLLTVTVRKPLRPDQTRCVRLRARYCGDAVYVLAQWPDTTRSDLRDPYVWNQEKQAYERSKKPDDQFALEFPLRGDFDINMLAAGRDYAADVWHWKAGRGNPVGWVDDKTHSAFARMPSWCERSSPASQPVDASRPHRHPNHAYSSGKSPSVKSVEEIRPAMMTITIGVSDFASLDDGTRFMIRATADAVADPSTW
jgi:hypothetical protein